TKEAIKSAVEDFLKKNNRSILSVRLLASIDLKKNEAGIIDFCNERNIEFKTIPEDIIRKNAKSFSFSSFVNSKVGVGNVSEACAMLTLNNTVLLCPKTVYRGITLALSQEKRMLYI
ncbi:MAG: cobalamin biosynthesis protein, partial [Candidatus Humimicrobiaceae bacterium]